MSNTDHCDDHCAIIEYQDTQAKVHWIGGQRWSLFTGYGSYVLLILISVVHSYHIL